MRGFESLEGRIALSASTASGLLDEALAFNAPNAHAAKGLALAATHANANAAKSKIFDKVTGPAVVPPEVTSILITPDNAATVTVLTATAAVFSPSAPSSEAYQWLQNGAPIASATNQTLNLNTLTVNVGDTFAVTVTPSVGSVVGTAVTSSPVTIATASPNPITLL